MEKPKEFEHPYVTVDVLIFSVKDGKFCTLLIKRSVPPFEGMFAIPGGFVAMEETLEEAAQRVIEVKGKMKEVYLEQLYTFGEVKRDPRGRVVSVSYFALVPRDRVKDINDGKHTVKWFAINELPPLAFDHKKIIEVALERIRAKIGYSSIALGLLPRDFRLTDLQNLYELILNNKLDKRNFRKRMLSMNLLEATGEKTSELSHRPAMLYRFKGKTPVVFD